MTETRSIKLAAMQIYINKAEVDICAITNAT